MLACDSEEISDTQARELRVWATGPMAQLFLKVAKGKEAAALCEAFKTHSQAPADNGKAFAAAEYEQARRYSVFLEVWQEITSEGRPKIVVPRIE